MSFPGELEALAPLDFTIAEGEFVAIVGPSGCGKSTLLRLVAGLIQPTSGTLKFAPHGSLGCASRISFVFQDATLLPWRSVADNVRLPLELSGVGDAQSAVMDALKLVQLDGFGNRRPSELSGGMRMRVSLARSLVTEPKLLLLDEPFAALDDVTRQQLNEELQRLWQARRFTALFVTHNIAEAVYLAQRVIVLSPRPGRIIADRAIDLPAVRTAALRATSEFAATCGELSAILREACT
jgi:NitT/TauT family transport system ATP-binding protein